MDPEFEPIVDAMLEIGAEEAREHDRALKDAKPRSSSGGRRMRRVQ